MNLIKKAVIIENNRDDLQILKKRLKECNSSIEILGHAMNAKSGVELIERIQPDLVFLDIELNQSSGFEIFDLVDECNFFTICVSSHKKYAFNAYQHNLLDFLQKPIKAPELKKSLEKFTEAKLHESSRNAEQIKRIKTMMDFDHSRFEIPTNYRKAIGNFNDLIYIEASLRYSKVKLKEKLAKNSFERVNKSFSKYLKKFESSPFIIQVHRKYLINLFQVKAVIGNNNAAVMSDNSEIPISRSNKTIFKEGLNLIQSFS